VTPADRDQAPQDQDDFQLIDVEQLKRSLLFTLHAVRRRPGVVAWTFVGVLSLAGLYLWVAPRTWGVEAELLAQKYALMPALGNPGRAVPPDADRPTRAAAETVLRRDNLLALMKQTDLMARWQQDRPALFRFKDRITDVLNPSSDEDKVNAMLGLLEKQLKVGTTEWTVNISIEWPNRDQAFRLVDAALQNFLEERHKAEVSTIAETISILDGHATSLREAIDSSVEDMRRASDPRSKSDPAPRPTVVFRRDPAREAVKAEAAEVKAMLDSKRRAIKELEEFRRRRLAELQAELAQQRTVYAERHPNIQKLEQSISVLEDDSPQLQDLRDEESSLQNDLVRLSATRADPVPTVPLTQPSAIEGQPRKRAPGRPDNVDDDYARTRLRFAMEKYDVLLSRIDNARIELDTAEAAFKYRYSITRPPILPRRPEKPKIPLVAGAAVLAAVLLSMLAAVLADRRSGRLLETWQVEQLLGLPLLGEMPRS
jgi:hypothetical protein